MKSAPELYGYWTQLTEMLLTYTAAIGQSMTAEDNTDVALEWSKYRLTCKGANYMNLTPDACIDVYFTKSPECHDITPRLMGVIMFYNRLAGNPKRIAKPVVDKYVFRPIAAIDHVSPRRCIQNTAELGILGQPNANNKISE